MFNFDPNDPRQAGLMSMALALMGSKGNLGQAFGQAGQQGLMAYQGAQGMQDRRAQEAQEREMRQMEMEQRRQALADRQGVRGAFQTAYGQPNHNLVSNDDQGYAMPQAPGGGGLQEFLKLAGPHMDPMQAVGLMQKQGPMKLGKDDRLVDPTTYREVLGATQEKPNLIGKVNPSEYTAESFRKFAASGNHADLVPYRKPDSDKPSKPQLYDSAGGPVWVTPEGATQPVTGPDGKPLSGKKRDQPLTESQARGTLFLGQMREAEKAIDGLKFKPETATAQAQLAAALKAKEAPGMVSGATLNWAAGKDAQQYAQAAEQWSESFLRIKTGAASTRDEVLRNVRTFFPQPGDKPAVIKQKNEARKAATKQMEIIAGHGTQQLEAQGGDKVVDWNDLK